MDKFLNALTAVGGKYIRKDSYGETQVKHILEELGVKYKQEKLFNIPIWGKSHIVRADFYLPKQNCVIEFPSSFILSSIEFNKIPVNPGISEPPKKIVNHINIKKIIKLFIKGNKIPQQNDIILDFNNI